ncbi:MAG TPA: SMC-Scp complex subunit ScpB [Myxococcales bacterium]|nr:SMC-Scp complex subunit ScpB [Myxococcales bacterium]
MTTEAERNGELPPDAAEASPTDEQELQQASQTELSTLVEAARLATPERASAIVEALLFAAERPLDLAALQDATQLEEQVVKDALEALRQKHAPGASGTVLVDLGGRWQLRTDPQLGAYVRRMLQVKPMRLTRAALETLAIVAYRQPVTRPEMEDLRGVDCGAVTKALLERKLVRILGKKDEPGRPLLYGTTREFLELFNLRDLTQLPTLREFQELSEENRKIVEEEAPPPPVAGLSDLAQDPQAAEKLAQHTAESDAALSQLEDAMDDAEERSKAAAQVLAPPPDPNATANATSTPASTATPNTSSEPGSETAARRQPPAAGPGPKEE